MERAGTCSKFFDMVCSQFLGHCTALAREPARSAAEGTNLSALFQTNLWGIASKKLYNADRCQSHGPNQNLSCAYRTPTCALDLEDRSSLVFSRCFCLLVQLSMFRRWCTSFHCRDFSRASTFSEAGKSSAVKASVQKRCCAWKLRTISKEGSLLF